MEDRIVDWLKQQGDQLVIDDFQIDEIRSGESNYNIVLETKDDRYVLRISQDVSRENRLKNEYKSLKLLKRNNIENVPEPVQLERDTAFGDMLLVEFVGSQDMKSDDFTEEQLSHLAETLAEIHSIEAEEYNQLFDADKEPQTTLNEEYRQDFRRWSEKPYREYLENTEKPDPEIKKYYRKQKELVESIPEIEIDQVFTHSDLRFNVRSSDDEIFIVDWEYGRVSYPGHELIYFFEHENLTEKQRKHFLSEYRKYRKLGKAFEETRERYVKFIAFNDAIWAANRLEDNPERSDMEELLANQLEKLETLYKD